MNTRDKLVEILDNFYYKNGGASEECEKLADYLIENNVSVTTWHRERPEKDGTYLVRRRLMFDNTEYIIILNWANNLYDIDNWDFSNKKNVCGWYGYNSEYGYYDVKECYIIEWMEMPK